MPLLHPKTFLTVISETLFLVGKGDLKSLLKDSTLLSAGEETEGDAVEDVEDALGEAGGEPTSILFVLG